ncbi:Glucose-6-phosphate 1-dehydrogenase [Babesia sp. Xinjiang]|uniref:Glucose-6-phosphate 1-dehydrogenase n=1 Tax=Babesia sp. Xinjiang TaxID=462227 RepID=UPI000A244168|nr:Glucose-6-phosphate 1-dehydrogenase [Babesia sp. Xinjiang]ORM42314.1 Glucose-6-phosphate 1-dehydrogenase [Babesia sp. Xinjiang]
MLRGSSALSMDADTTNVQSLKTLDEETSHLVAPKSEIHKSNSTTSLSSLVTANTTHYLNWLKTFYANKLNEVIHFREAVDVLTHYNCRMDDVNDADDIVEPCLLDCHTEEGFVMAAMHLIVHHIKAKQAESPTSIVTIGLSGGTTPRAIYRHMGSLDDLDIDFNRIIFFLVDERYVPPTDELSNQRLIRNTLLKSWPIPEEHIIFPDTTLPLEECVSKYESDLEKIFGMVEDAKEFNDQTHDPRVLGLTKSEYTTTPDLITLGIGDDFHIAGLFPDYLSTLDPSHVTDCRERVMITKTDTAVVHERLTLSLPFLCCAKSKLFFLKGERKKRIWTTMMQYRHVDPIRFPATQIFTKPGCVAVLDSSCIRRIRRKIPMEQTDSLTFILFGSNGDLARRKLYPALFHLFYLGFLPAQFRILAVSRSHQSFDDFFETVSKDIFASINTTVFVCEAAARFDFPTVIAEFKKVLRRITIRYDEPQSLVLLHESLNEIEAGSPVSHRLIYLATPAEAYHPIMKLATSVCRRNAGWFRVMLEKPFGRDLGSSQEILRVLNEHARPEEMFLVDHYLGKPLISCIIAIKRSLRYSDLFCRRYVKSVHIKMKESIGSFGRSYFDQYGIIRDMVQNHGMQLLSLIAMDHPDRLSDSLADEKCKVLRAVSTVGLEDTILGQYSASADGTECAYVDETGVPQDSLCSTFCSMVLYVDNDKWRGVPFVITAGKGMDERLCEISLNVRDTFASDFGAEFEARNLVFRVQPNPSVFWCVNAQQLSVQPDGESLLFSSDQETDSVGLKVEERILRGVDYNLTKLPVVGCYEILLYHAFGGKRNYFPTIDEVNESWRILTPLLHEIDTKRVRPVLYPRKSSGPVEQEAHLKLLD